MREIVEASAAAGLWLLLSGRPKILGLCHHCTVAQCDMHLHKPKAPCWTCDGPDTHMIWFLWALQAS